MSQITHQQRTTAYTATYLVVSVAFIFFNASDVRITVQQIYNNPHKRRLQVRTRYASFDIWRQIFIHRVEKFAYQYQKLTRKLYWFYKWCLKWWLCMQGSVKRITFLLKINYYNSSCHSPYHPSSPIVLLVPLFYVSKGQLQ